MSLLTDALRGVRLVRLNLPAGRAMIRHYSADEGVTLRWVDLSPEVIASLRYPDGGAGARATPGGGSPLGSGTVGTAPLPSTNSNPVQSHAFQGVTVPGLGATSEGVSQPIGGSRALRW